MADYKKMYAVLFNAITDALDALQAQNPVLAAVLLVQAQQHTETLYIESSDDE